MKNGRPLKREQDETLHSGSIVHWTEREPKQPGKRWTRAMVTCGRCGCKRMTVIKKERQGWTGFCTKCAHRSLLKDEKLPSGSVIHWGRRDLKYNYKAPVTCGKCGKERMVTIQMDRHSGKWTGLCHGCAHTKYSKDVKLASGSIIHWNQRDSEKPSKRTRVTCGKCETKRLTTIPHPWNNWSGYCFNCTSFKITRIKDETLPSGSVINWNERDPHSHRRVKVTCGKCGKSRFIGVNLPKDRTKVSGFCVECASIKKEGKKPQPLDSGSVIHWNERDPEKRGRIKITCGKCERTRWSHINSHRINSPGYTGFCSSCAHGRFQDEEDRLPSDSVINWSKRDDRKRMWVTCGLCQEGRYANVPSSDEKRKAWSGFCSKCRSKQREEPKLKRTDNEQLPSGSIIHWGERDPNDVRRAMVTCILCGEKTTRTIPSGAVKKIWSGTCRPMCDLEAFRAHQSCLQNNPENKGKQKRQQTEQARIAADMANIEDAILTEWDKVKAATGLTFDEKAGLIKQRAVAVRVEPRGLDPKLCEDRMRSRLRTRGFDKKFKKGDDWWHEYVKSVIRERRPEECK